MASKRNVNTIMYKKRFYIVLFAVFAAAYFSTNMGSTPAKSVTAAVPSPPAAESRAAPAKAMAKAKPEPVAAAKPEPVAAAATTTTVTKPSVDTGAPAAATSAATPSIAASIFKPTPATGTYYVQKRSETANACDAWLQPKFAHNKEIDFPLATHKVCHQHEGWTKFDKLQGDSPQECKDWYNRHPADDGMGAHCWEEPGSWQTDKSVTTSKSFIEGYWNSMTGNNLGNALSCNDPIEAAEQQGKLQSGEFDILKVAKKPVRTARQQELFESCVVQPLCDKARGPWHPLENTKVSQVTQDSAVSKIFGYKTNGVYLDIGAADGIEYSNTFYLDKCYGWSGLMVDANWIRYMGLAGAGRSGDMVYGCVMDKDCTQKFTIAAGLSSVDAIEELAEGGHAEHTARRNQEKSEATMRKATVPCYNFSELVQRWMKHRGVEVIDYMTIDIEGAEWHALKSLDLSKVPIRLIGIETDYTNDKFVKFLQDAGYKHLKEHDVGDALWYREIGDSQSVQGKMGVPAKK